MEPTTFRIACEAYDRLAGSEDWVAFGQVFDRVLDGLSAADQDLVGRLIQELKRGRGAASESASSSWSSIRLSIGRRLVSGESQT